MILTFLFIQHVTLNFMIFTSAVQQFGNIAILNVCEVSYAH